MLYYKFDYKARMDIEYKNDCKIAYVGNVYFVRDNKTGYYLSHKHGIRLHRYIWQIHNGFIPSGHHIHHKDHNKSNNEISNLELISASEHMSLHMTEERRAWARGNLNRNARPKAIEWHKSKEGRAWHSEHGKNVSKNMKKKEYTCLSCNSSFFKTPHGENKFCSNKCKSRYRRSKGYDNVTKHCLVCNNKFTSNKYAKAFLCSRKCVGQWRIQKNQIN